MLPAQPNQSLIDGLACLQCLAARGQAVGTREMAQQLGLETTRVNRLLKTLAHLGLAQQDAQRKYRPGPAVHVLAAQTLFGSGLLRRAMPALHRLRSFHCIVALGVLWRDQVAYLYHASPDTPADEAVGRTGLFPATGSGIGCALLARLSLDELAARLGPAVTASLRRDLKRFARQGYAVVKQPRHQLGVAVAIDDYAAVGVSGVLDPPTVARVAAALQTIASDLAQESTS